jgi:hypothetical protein
MTKNKKQIKNALKKMLRYSGYHMSMRTILSNWRSFDFNIKDGTYLIFLLEKCGVIERLKSEEEVYDFKNEPYKSFFGDIHYFQYRISDKWMGARANSDKVKKLINIIIKLYNNDILVNAIPSV